MINLKSFFILFLFVLFFSCKKDKGKDLDNNISSAQEGGTLKVEGEMNVSYNYWISSDSVRLVQAYVLANFYDNPKSIDSLEYYIQSTDVGNVTLNDSTFGKCCFQPHLSYFYSPISQMQIEDIKKSRRWNISGTELFRTCSFSDDTPLPEYNIAKLPDTLFKNKSNVIKLGNYTGESPIEVMIIFPGDRTRPKKILRSDKEIVFTQSDLESFFEFEDVKVTIRFTLANTSYKTIKRRKFRLNSTMVYETKEIYFKF